MLTQAEDLIRERVIIAERQHQRITIDGKEYINFCSNDYLNFADEPKIKKAFIEGVERYGFGSGSSAQISGFYYPHKMLEEKIAEFFKRERALLFNSGYLANIGVIATLVNRSGTIFSDKFCHASILDGIHLSRAKHIRYRHNDLNHLKTLISRQKHINNTIVISEGVFSMEGDICCLDQLATLAKQQQLLLIIDDAHGVGVLGKNGRGICEYFNLSEKDIPCLVVPLGKAFASLGGAVVGSNDLIESLLQFAKTNRYSTALPPAVSHATIATFSMMEQENWRRERLQTLIHFFIEQAKFRCLPLISDAPTPIKSLLIGGNRLTIKIQQALMQKGFFISCIRPPTVPQGTARIRISLNSMHQEQDIINLLDSIAEHYAQQSQSSA